ncbi:signal peptidase II [Sinanaerobacter sp. ZZT-01]|uniref:signal peptidase II n=1 Tax=Sinanaerobacter sp. ZZT-01 TaxID=3111540 RepID=UPI002D78C3C9|nr:signal peptidase II [Sinanaerobacter sp. ZZT-01]WRR92829.1 signal peptidase II [Sinanaerobacter sp. ZZT-01]
MYYVVIIAAVVALDQVTKYLVQVNMDLNHTIPILDGIFHFTYIHNYGAAFRILENHQIFLLSVTGLVIIGMFLYLLWKRKTGHILFLISVALIIGGGIGNFIDRALQGYVVDFFDFRIWPIFNIADIAVVCGCILFSFFILYWEPRLHKKAQIQCGEEE